MEYNSTISNNLQIKELHKILTKSEASFLKRLIYWSNHRNSYGIIEDGKVWIYNTLEDWSKQLNVSVSTFRRAVKSLKEQNLIFTKQLSKNRRDRTLFYAINESELENMCSKSRHFEHINEQMDEQMYIKNNIHKHINYKSNKSSVCNANIDLSKNNLEKEKSMDGTSRSPAGRATNGSNVTLDMMKVWKEEFPNKPIVLCKEICRFLVSAFKNKFGSSLKEWRKYLKLLKTSTYLMGEKFKLSFSWIIKFITIDRIRAGELGVNEDKILPDLVDVEEAKKKAIEHAESVNESDKCRQRRKDIIHVLSHDKYNAWFKDVELFENDNEIYVRTENRFTKDFINQHFSSQCELIAV